MRPRAGFESDQRALPGPNAHRRPQCRCRAWAVLSLDLLPQGETATPVTWVQELPAVLGAEVLVSDDADGFKAVADVSGLQYVCNASV